MVFTLLLVSLVTFSVVQVLPGDVASAILGQDATAEDLAIMRAKLGLDRPAHVRYVEWLAGFMRGDMGTSMTVNMDAGPLIMQRLGRSALLGGLAFVIAVPLALALGVIAGLFRDKLPDYLVSVGTLAAVSVPEFVTGSVLILVFATWLGIAPPTSLGASEKPPLEALRALALPAVTLTLVMLAHTARMTRASMIDVMRSHYVRTAVLKGLPRAKVVTRHALRNALLPSITVIALNTGWLIGGLVVVENVFGYAGLGRLLIESIETRDVMVLQSIAVLVAAIYALANLVADVLYTRLDPRIRYS